MFQGILGAFKLLMVLVTKWYEGGLAVLSKWSPSELEVLTKWSVDRVVVRSRSQIIKPDALFVAFLGIKWAHDIVKKNRS